MFDLERMDEALSQNELNTLSIEPDYKQRRRTQKNRKLQPYGLEAIEIAKFRNITNMVIPLGQYITVLAGQNGTSKSTILGMLGQPFGLASAKTIFGKSCKTKFTDIFKLSPNHDKAGDHLYFIDFRDESISDGKQHIQVKSYERKGATSGIRFVTGATRKRGDGNINYPVIYLGMKRVYPIGEMTNLEASAPELSTNEIEKFTEWYLRIMVPATSSGFDPVKMTKKGQKETLLINTGVYDFLANSAGQDNLGQILAALISFQRIKEEMGSDYKGALLLIDEVDATLFPASQKGLFEVFFEVAPILNLQIVFTTHSTDLLDLALSKAGKGKEVEVAYLKLRGEKIKLEINPSMDDVRSDLLIEPLPKEKSQKVEVWCEDDEAAWFLRKMLPTDLKQKCDIVSAKLSCGELAELSIRKLRSIQDVVFVVDSDFRKKVHKKAILECRRLFVLPGNGESPERSIFTVLEGMPAEDVRWDDFGRNYTKQHFRKFRLDDEKSHEADGGKIDRKFEKKWFSKTKKQGFWGKNGDVIYKLWSSMYSDEIEVFIDELKKRIDITYKKINQRNQ